jgi:DNA-binding MarR family transcriptional regulator
MGPTRTTRTTSPTTSPATRTLLDDDRLTRAGLFFEAAEGVQRALEASLQERCGISGQHFEILTRLARSPGERLRMCDLATQTAMSPSGLTRAVDRLVDAGYVSREHCPEDRRVAWAQLTPAGLARIEEAVPVALEQLETLFFAPLDDAQLAQFDVLLRAVRDHVRPEAAHVSDADADPA